MKPVLAFILSVIMVFSSINISSFAYSEETDDELSLSLRDSTLNLPSSLKTIESEAFFGNTSVSCVVVPYGCESIGSHAFAFSGLADIYIPETVTSIHENAFEGSEDAVVHATEGTYAAQYAKDHDMLCEGNHMIYAPDQLQGVLGGLDRIDELPTDGQQDINISFIDVVDLPGQEFLEAAEKYNSLMSELSALCEVCDQSAQEFSEIFDEIRPEVESVDIQASSDGVTMNTGEFAYGICGGADVSLGQDVTVLSMEATEDGGSLRMEIESDGNRYYLVLDDDGVNLFGASQLRNRDAEKYQPIAVAKGIELSGSKVRSILSWLEEKRVFVSEWFLSASVAIEKWFADCSQKSDTAHRALEIAENTAESIELAKQDAYNQYLKAANAGDVEKMEFFSKQRAEYSKSLLTFEKQISEGKKNCLAIDTELKAARELKAFWAGLNILDSLYTLTTDGVYLAQLISIQKHGHPLDGEADNPTLSPIVDELNRSIPSAYATISIQALYAAMNLYESLTTIAATVGRVAGPAGLSVALIAKLSIKTVKENIRSLMEQITVQIIVQGGVDYCVNRVKSLDDQLHSLIAGQVFSEETGKPLARVQVTCGNRTAYTNSQGFYSITCGVGEQILTFTKQGYNMREFAVNVSPYSSRKMPPIYMDSRGTVAGYVRDAVTGKALSGVTVTYGYYETTTNDEGFYQFVLPIGTADMSFSKDGYITGEYKEVPSDANTTTVRDMVLSKELNGDQFRVVLTWGASPSDLDSHLVGPGYHVSYSNKTATGAALDLDDTTSYGPETTTFTINNTETYKFYVHDYSNGGNAGSAALGRSGATVTVFNGSSAIATVHVPGGVGTYWNVFQIVSGEFKLINTIGSSMN